MPGSEWDPICSELARRKVFEMQGLRRDMKQGSPSTSCKAHWCPAPLEEEIIITAGAWRFSNDMNMLMHF